MVSERRVDNADSHTLLVVENQPRLRLELALGLGELYDVAAVASAGEALELIARGTSFDLLLCELRMPEMNGVQFCEHLAAIQSGLASRVVLMSEGVPDAGTRHALAMLPNPCITRPFENEALIALLERWSERQDPLERPWDVVGTAPRSVRLDAARVFALTARLIRGEILDLIDERGRVWHGSGTALILQTLDPAEPTALIRGHAADIALEIVRRRLRSREARSQLAARR
jgi:CheY-like chemotaxis protein